MPLRRSARPISNISGHREEATDQDIGDNASDDDYSNQAKKRRRIAPSNAAGESSRTRGRRGKLRQLPEMPLDILFDVRPSIATT
jgi:hypothetical protein